MQPPVQISVWVVVLALQWATVLGQPPTEKDYQRYRYVDTTDRQESGRDVLWRFEEVRPTEKFDLILGRTFAVTIGQVEAAAVSPGLSGTWHLGLGFNWLLNRRKLFALTAEPAITFHGFEFPQRSDRTFPTQTVDSLRSERIRATFVELNAALRLNIRRDTSRRKLLTYLEIGGNVGYAVARSFRFTTTDTRGNVVEEAYPDYPAVTPVKVQVFARLVYRFLGLWAQYRVTPYFRPDAVWDFDPPARSYPVMPPFELGFVIMI